MYTWEMVNFINERNRYIGGDDLLTILSLKLNPQITYIKYFPTLELSLIHISEPTRRS